MTRHELKTHPEPFAATWYGRKCYEVRKDDRGFAIGDTLVLREYAPDTGAYSGAELTVIVTYMTRGGDYGLPADVCVMSVRVTHFTTRPDFALKFREVTP